MPLTRRSFIRTATLAAGAAFTAKSWSQVIGANNDIRVAIAGLNGRGKEFIRALREVAGVRIVALCDADSAVLDRELAGIRSRGRPVPDRVLDYRDLLVRPDIDAIAIATPNHLHALQSIWAMQAGKDVLHEKPVTHNIWEGAQILAAARKYRRIVQVFTQNRSSTAIAEALAWMQAGHLGKLQLVRGLVYKRRLSIGKTAGPVAPPPTVNYDFFQGPAPLVPLRRVNFHYDWHWQWETGNGDMVAQGNHQLDVGRRMLGDPGHPRRVFTVGGRFGYVDDGETPNTFLVYYDYPTVPFVFEVRGLPAKPDELSGGAVVAGGLGTADKLSASMDKFFGLSVGNIAHCEGGYLAVSNQYGSAEAFDRDGRSLRKFTGMGNHYTNFLDAMRSRREADLAAPLGQGHLSSALVHLANLSYRTGRTLAPGDIRDQLGAKSALTEPYERFTRHLAANAIDLARTPATLGAPLTFDAATEMFTGENRDAANQLRTREYRAPWIVPQLA